MNTNNVDYSRKGGLATLAKYGAGYLRHIGKKGGIASGKSVKHNRWSKESAKAASLLGVEARRRNRERRKSVQPI